MSSTNAEFCDTNVLSYAHDSTAARKQQQAVDLIDRLWVERTGVISVQVLQELYGTLTRKMRPPQSESYARQVIVVLSAWRVIVPGHAEVLRAIDASARWQISFWDAMLLTTAQMAGASVLWTEDLNDGQVYDGTMARNPFR